MTLEQLKMLIKVAELGSLKVASETLFKTQPATRLLIAPKEERSNQGVMFIYLTIWVLKVP